MPITSQGWELHIVREIEQRRPSDGRRRTVGRYQVYHDGVAQTGTDLSGMTAEAKGPGANAPVDNGKRIEAGRYPLLTHEPGGYATWGYSNSQDPAAEPKPAFELKLKDTDPRDNILVHPGHHLLASVGCINLCKSCPHAREPISHLPSRKRVISVIEDMKKYLGTQFPTSNGMKIPGAWVVIDGEP